MNQTNHLSLTPNSNKPKGILKFIKAPEFYLVLIIIFSFIIRIWHLGQIKKLIFDELYFVNFARNYINHVSFFDIHPPLGKLIIASAIKLLGDTQTSWRIPEVIIGTLFIGLIYLVGTELKNKTVGLITALLIAFDGIFLVYSRVGLMDIFLVFFIILTFYFCLRFARTRRTSDLIFAGIALGLAASIKYVGFLGYGMIITVFLARNISLKENKWRIIICLFLIPIIIYVLDFLANFPVAHLLPNVYKWQITSYQSNLQQAVMHHPYASKWWGWLILYRPVCLYFETLPDGRYMALYALGNPFLWWSALVVLPVWLWQIFRKDKNSLILFVSFLFFLIPWAFVKRSLFIYHSIPSFTFLVLGLSIILEGLTKYKIGRWILGLYLILVVASFLYFLPLWLAIPIRPEHFYNLMLFRNWI